MEEERRRIEFSGEVDKIIESLGGVVGEAGAGRGRGRAVSHLPAWLVKRQQEKELGAAEKKEDGRCDNAPGNHEEAWTISLLNIVAPGQVDNELSFEVCEDLDNMAKCSMSPSLMLIPTKSM